MWAGQVADSAYGWKSSFREWKRISSLEEFNPRARLKALPPVPDVPTETASDLLRNVVEVSRPDLRPFLRPHEEAPPAEAEPYDLVSGPPPLHPVAQVSATARARAVGPEVVKCAAHQPQVA